MPLALGLLSPFPLLTSIIPSLAPSVSVLFLWGCGIPWSLLISIPWPLFNTVFCLWDSAILSSFQINSYSLRLLNALSPFELSFNLKAFSLGLGNPFNLNPFNLNPMVLRFFNPLPLLNSIPLHLHCQCLPLGLRDPLAPSISLPCLWNYSVSLSSVPQFL